MYYICGQYIVYNTSRFAMTELTDSAIMIQALEDAGRIEHIDVDAEQLEVIAKKITLFDLPPIKRFFLSGFKGTGRPADRNCTVKIHRLYYQAQETQLDTITEHTIREMNIQTFRKAAFNKKLFKTIEVNWLDTSSDKEVALLMDSIKHKQAFFHQNKCITPDELATTLNFTDKNIARAAKKLMGANEIIGIKRNERYVYPAFQFNRKGIVFPALKNTIPVVKEYGIDNLDYCIWLSEYCSEVLHSPVNNHTYLNMSFEKMMDTATAANAQNKVYQGKPIDAIVEGDTDTFSQLFSLWLSPETYDVHNTAGGMGG
jgi:hypothetical protein